MEFKENINVSTIVIVGTWNFGIFTPEWVKGGSGGQGSGGQVP